MIEFEITDAADQQFGTILNRRRCTFRFRFNHTSQRWSFDLSVDDLPVLHGRRVVTGTDLLGAFDLDLGHLFALNNPTYDGAPDRNALPARLVRLYHVTEEELAEYEAISA